MADNKPLNTFGRKTDDINVLLEILKQNIFINLNVCLPANVVSYNNTNNTVTLQPAIQAVLTDNTFLSLPKLYNVPVLELGGNDLSIKIPLKDGDTGIVIFCDRDISLFKQEKKNTQPNTLRKHSLSDGIFIPMRFGSSGSSNILIQSSDGATQFEITSSGINVKGDITVDGDVIVGGIGMKKHIHGNGNQGADTFAPKNPPA